MNPSKTKLQKIKNNFIKSINIIIKNRNKKIKKITQKQDQEKIQNLLDKLK